MVRIDDENLVEKSAIERTYKHHPECTCGDSATIWIRLKDDLFLCDVCAFHLARILMEDIGHPAKIVRGHSKEM